VEDARKVDKAAQEGKKLVVIGSSFIGMELVVALSKRKLASINVVGMEEYPFESVLGKEVGAGLKKYHESQGVKFHMSSRVEKVIPSADNPALAGGVVISSPSSGTTETVTLDADFVILGVGVRPATDFLQSNPGFELEPDGGLLVDEYLRVVKGRAGESGVYALGDIAVYPQSIGVDAITGEKTKRPVRIEHWNVAGNHGRAVGKTIAGVPQEYVKVPVFWSAQGQQLRYCGFGAIGYDDVILKGDPAEMKFIAYYVKERQIVAVASMQNDPVVVKASELLRLGLMPSVEDIKDGKELLSVDISTVSAKARVASA